MARFEIVYLTKMELDEQYPNRSWFFHPSDDDDYAAFVVDTKKNEIVFQDGSYDSPEDNYLDRHYRGLVDLLNGVDEE